MTDEQQPAARDVGNAAGVDLGASAPRQEALQEQLVDKDLPLLSDILPWDFSFALIKGRNNYLCHDRLYQEEAQGTLELLDEPGDAGMLEALVAWARENMAPYKAPREVRFIDALPATGAGKVLRRLLKDE